MRENFLFFGLFSMLRRWRPNFGRRIQSNVRRATLRANRTDDQRETDNNKNHNRIGMEKLSYAAT